MVVIIVCVILFNCFLFSVGGCFWVDMVFLFRLGEVEKLIRFVLCWGLDRLIRFILCWGLLELELFVVICFWLCGFVCGVGGVF